MMFLLSFFGVASGTDKSPGNGLLIESGEYLLFTESLEVIIEE